MALIRHACKSRMTRSAIAMTGVCAFALLAASGAQAQKAPPPSDDYAAPGDIVVTANKRAEPLSSVAMAISVETGEKLDRQNSNGLQDYVGNLPNVSLQTFGSPGLAKVIIRGINSVTFNATTGTYIDDIPFGSSTLFAGGALLTPDLDPSILERVEVLKGPQGTLYGASAPGGVIKFVTRQPDTRTFSFGAKEELSSVAHGELGFALRANTNIPIAKDTLALRVNGFYRRDPGYLDNAYDGEKNVNRVVSKGVNASLLWTPAPTLSVKLNGIFQNLNSEGLNGVAVDQAAFFGLIPDTPREIIPVFGRYDTLFTLPESNHTRTRVASATINYEITPSISLVSATSYSLARNDKLADYTPDYVDLVPEGDKVQFVYGLKTRKFTQELRLSSQADGGRFEWLLGAFYTSEKSKFKSDFQPVHADNSFDNDTTIVYGDNEFTTYKEYAFFGNLTYYLTPKLDITVGARYAHNRTTFVSYERGLYGNPDDPETDFVSQAEPAKDSVVSYLADLRWKPTETTLLYLRAASGYRPGGPRFLPLGLTPPPGFTNKFGSEKLWNYEVGARAELFDRRLTISGAAYYIDWSNVQGYLAFGAFGAFGNAGDAESKGFELEITARPITGLSISAGFGYSNAKLTRADPTFGAPVGGALPFAPKVTFTINPEYEWAVGGDWRAFIGGNVQYQSKRYSNIEGVFLSVPLEAYGTVDLHAGLRSGKFDITLFAKNISDVYAGVADNSTMFNAPAAMGINTPRTIGISFSQSF